MKSELLVIANSLKNGGRCLAGINMATGELVRPVQDPSGAQLSDSVTCLENRFLRPGDLIGIELQNSVSQPHHPENQLFKEGTIELISSDNILANVELIVKLLRENPYMVRSNTDRIYKYEIEELGQIDGSLSIVLATEISFYVNQYGKPRIKFNLNGKCWDLANTDDKGAWRGKYSRGLVCLSLGEFYALKDAYFKLACGFIPLDAHDFNWPPKTKIEIRAARVEDLPSIMDIIDSDLIVRRIEGANKRLEENRNSQILHFVESRLDEQKFNSHIQNLKNFITQKVSRTAESPLEVLVAVQETKIVGFCSWTEQPYWTSFSEFDLWIALQQMHVTESRFDFAIRYEMLKFLAQISLADSMIGLFGWSDFSTLGELGGVLKIESVDVLAVSLMWQRYIWYLTNDDILELLEKGDLVFEELRESKISKLVNASDEKDSSNF